MVPFHFVGAIYCLTLALRFCASALFGRNRDNARLAVLGNSHRTVTGPEIFECAVAHDIAVTRYANGGNESFGARIAHCVTEGDVTPSHPPRAGTTSRCHSGIIRRTDYADPPDNLRIDMGITFVGVDCLAPMIEKPVSLAVPEDSANLIVPLNLAFPFG